MQGVGLKAMREGKKKRRIGVEESLEKAKGEDAANGRERQGM